MSLEVQFFNVSEDMRFVTLCTVLTGAIDRSVAVALQSFEGSATGTRPPSTINLVLPGRFLTL